MAAYTHGEDPLNPRRMIITYEERELALDIKEAIKADPEISNLSDFMYAHLALVVKDNVAEALRRAEQLQGFREEYGILDNAKEGNACFKKFVQQHPRQLLNFSFNSGRYILIHDMVEFDSTCIKTHDQMQIFMTGSYYLLQALVPDLEAIRRGPMALVECEGFSFSKKKSFKVFETMFSELMSVYPTWGEIKHFNSPVFFNIMASMLRRFLPLEMKDKFHTGCQFEGGRLDTVYLMPTADIATDRIRIALAEALRIRYLSQTTFSLDEYDNIDGESSDEDDDDEEGDAF